MTPARILLLLALGAALGACVRVPADVARELAPPDGGAPDHYRLRDRPDD